MKYKLQHLTSASRMQIKGWKSSNHPWIVADTHADTEVEI